MANGILKNNTIKYKDLQVTLPTNSNTVSISTEVARDRIVSIIMHKNEDTFFCPVDRTL